MKKLLTLSLTAAVAVAFAWFAASAASGATIDTSTLQKAFQNASSVDKTDIQNAISALKSHDYSGALQSLGKVVTSTNLTSSQKSAVQNTMNQVKTNQLSDVQKSISGLTNQAGQGLDKATDGSNKALNN